MSVNNEMFDMSSLQSDKGKVDDASQRSDHLSELIQVLESLERPESEILSFDDVVTKSSLGINCDARRIAQEFNQNRPTIMIRSIVGDRIQPDEYRLVALNRKPELVPFSNEKTRLQYYPSANDKAEILGVFKQTALCIGGYGSYVLNIPIGKLGLGMRGLTPVIFGEGTHVIHDANFQPFTQANLIDMSSEYIRHGTYHIFRVPTGHLAKITIGSTPYVLTARKNPYVFNNPVFQLVHPFTRLTEGWINHGNYNILQVPFGKLAKIWLGSKPLILEANDHPYLYKNPAFSLSLSATKENFENASEQLIVHGCLKRIIPQTGEVAITYDNGSIVIHGPPKDGKPILITDPNHVFGRFLPVNTQTIEFPTEKTRLARRRENPNDIESSNYEVFRTNDGLPIGVKLLVVYELVDPLKVLKKLPVDQILSHIEAIVTADMGMVIQQCGSNDFLKSNQTQARPTIKPSADPTVPSAPEFYSHLSDLVRNKLCDDFAEFGIKLLRLNVETPKILDSKISSEMARFSLMTSEATAKEAVMERNASIAKQQAMIDAQNRDIAQKQLNDTVTSKAQVEYNAAKLAQKQINESLLTKAEAELNAAKMKADAKLVEANAENKIKELALQIQKQQGQLYKEYPQLLQREIAQLHSSSMKGITSTVISPEVAQVYYGMGVMGRHLPIVESPATKVENVVPSAVPNAQ